MKTALRLTVWTALSLIALNINAQNSSGRRMPEEELRSFAAVYSLLVSDSPLEFSERELLISAIKGMVRSADPDGGFYAKEEMHKIQGDETINQPSAGLHFDFVDNGIIVSRVIPFSPAHRAGIKAGDRLIKINDLGAEGLRPNQIDQILTDNDRVRVLKLELLRDKYESLRFTIAKEIIQKTDVKFDIRPDGIGLLSIFDVRSNTFDRLVAQLSERRLAASLKFLIIDLRESSGGLLNEVLKIASVFLPEGKTIYQQFDKSGKATSIVSIRERASRDFPWSRNSSQQLSEVPIIILIGESTAAGAEILALALRENGRAMIVGRNSLGKSSLQVVRQISPDFVLKMTTAHWKSPLGTDVRNIGITPERIIEKSSAELELNQVIRIARDMCGASCN